MRNIIWLTLVLVATGAIAAAYHALKRQISATSQQTERTHSGTREVARSGAPLDSGASASAPCGPIHFTDMTAASGVDFVHVSGDSSEKPFPAANGSGVATVDFDLDGQVDLYFLTGAPFPVDPARSAPGNRCFRNLGDWHFADVTGPSGLGDRGYSSGVASGDFDNDGFPDLFVNGIGSHRLYRNRGDGTFAECGSAAGLDSDHWGTSAAFFDYDGDGLLDLYVCHYGVWSLETNRFCGDRARGIRIFCNPTAIEPAPHLLFHNEGDGTFVDASEPAGVGGRLGRGQGVVAADVNGDGLIDFYVANDLHPNWLFLNSGNGTFEEIGEESGTATDFQGRVQAGMGVDAADMNRDGRLDLFVTNYEGEHNAYYENLGDHLFQDLSRNRGLAAESIPWVGWGTALADLDLDGWPDVVVTNGHTDNNLKDVGRDAPYQQVPGLWRNVEGRCAFVGGAQAGSYFTTPHVGRGLAVADLDNDGDLDLVIVHQDAAAALLRNDCPAALELSWTGVQIIGTTGNRNSIGAELSLSLPTGETIVQQVKGGGSYESASDLRQVMAIARGAMGAKLEIRWPSGAKTEIDPVPRGRYIRIIEGGASRAPLAVFRDEASSP